jgi:probable selenium-dependent hydroxylase accessory protein YqeC
MGTLVECFDIGPQVRSIALVGAGGKTSLLYALARELTSRREKIVTTTTTKILPPLSDQSPHLILLSEDPELLTLPQSLARLGHVTVGKAISESTGKMEGAGDDAIMRCLNHAQRVIIEADGAAGRPIKAPEAWEPVIPDFVQLVIPVVGLDCLGKPASERWVFRLERFLAVTGLMEGQPIGTQSIAAMLKHPAGGLKGIPSEATVVPFLNKADLLPSQAGLTSLLNDLASPRIRRVVVGKLKGGVQVDSYSLTAPPSAS